MDPLDWIWLAADSQTRAEYFALTEPLRGVIRNVKVRRHLTAAAGLQIVGDVREQGFNKVFDDEKFYDIPDSLEKDLVIYLQQHPDMINCLAECGPEAMSKMAALCRIFEVESIAVTVLTSKDEALCQRQYGRSAAEQVRILATDAADAGIDSILCSAKDLATLEKAGLLERFKGRYTPGIRPTFAQAGDQSRIMTPADAWKAGSTGGIMGRPIYDRRYGKPQENVDRICEELAAVM